MGITFHDKNGVPLPPQQPTPTVSPLSPAPPVIGPPAHSGYVPSKISIPVPNFGKTGASPFSWAVLAVAVAGMLFFAKMGHKPDASSGTTPGEHNLPLPVPGVVLTADNPPFGLLIVRGTVQFVKRSQSQGLIVETRADDGTPFSAWLGPDVSGVPSIRPRDHVAFTGKLSGGLFIVQEVQREKVLSERTTYNVAGVRDGIVYVEEGGHVYTFPQPENFNGKTITVSRYNGKLVVE